MLFQQKKSNKTMLQYSTVVGKAIGENRIEVDGKTYRLFTNPLHLQDEAKPLDLSAHLGRTVKIAGGVGTDTIYEAKVVEH